jgi:hypothetical protein
VSCEDRDADDKRDVSDGRDSRQRDNGSAKTARLSALSERRHA